MKSRHAMISAITLAALAGIATNGFAGEEKEESISLDKVPAAVKHALIAYAQDSEVKKIEKGRQDGKRVYEFDIEQGAKKFEIALSSKGKFMGREEDIDVSAMPAAVQKTFNDLAAGGKISGGEKALDKHSKITYEAVIEKGGKPTEVSVDGSGKVVGTENASDEKD